MFLMLLDALAWILIIGLAVLAFIFTGAALGAIIGNPRSCSPRFRIAAPELSASPRDFARHPSDCADSDMVAGETHQVIPSGR